MESTNEQNAFPQIALVVGAASGIGKAVALKFRYKIICADINSKGAEETSKQIQNQQKNQDSSIFIEVDVANAESVEKMVKTCLEKYKRIDACFNGAGIEGDRANIAEYDEKMFDKVMNTNLKGIISQYKGIECRATIINCSSTAGLEGMAEFSPYCCTKWGVLGLTKTAAAEYISKGIRINAICPSTTDTPMVERFAQQWPEWQAKQNSSFKIGRIGQPEEIAETVLFLCSDKAPFIIGTQIVIAGGN